VAFRQIRSSLLQPTLGVGITLSMKRLTAIFFRCESVERPVLTVAEKKDQVVIAIRSERDEHLTIHRDRQEGVIFTHYAPDLSMSTWDKLRVEAAKKCGYGDPVRHANYIQHRPLFEPVIGADGHELVGRRINIEMARPKTKYEKGERITVNAPASEFMLTLILSTPGQPYSALHEAHVESQFGALYFRASAIEKYPTNKVGPDISDTAHAGTEQP
jgi:hypothetical protein